MYEDFSRCQHCNSPWTVPAGADPGDGQHCLGHGQIFGRAKQLFCLLVLLLIFGSRCGPTSAVTRSDL